MTNFDKTIKWMMTRRVTHMKSRPLKLLLGYYLLSPM